MVRNIMERHTMERLVVLQNYKSTIKCNIKRKQYYSRIV